MSIFLIIMGYSIAGLAVWRYKVKPQKRLKVGGILCAIMATVLLIATLAGPIKFI